MGYLYYHLWWFITPQYCVLIFKATNQNPDIAKGSIFKGSRVIGSGLDREFIIQNIGNFTPFVSWISLKKSNLCSLILMINESASIWNYIYLKTRVYFKTVFSCQEKNDIILTLTEYSMRFQTLRLQYFLWKTNL